MKSLPLWLLSILFVTAAVCGAKSPSVSDDDRAKAAYLFLEASAHLADNNFGTAYYMLSRAAELTPDDDAIAAELGKIVIYGTLTDSAGFEQSYDAIKRLFYANPSDVQNGYTLITIAQHLNRIEDIKAAYRALMDAHPGNAEYALNYASYRAVDFLEGDSTGPREAFEIYDRLETGVGLTDLLTLHRLHTLTITGDTAEMIRQIGRFTATAPLDPQVNFYTGSMYDMINLPDSAIIYYTSACLLDSTFGQAYLARAEHYLAGGDSTRYEREVLHALESTSLEFDAKYDILSGYARSMYADPERRLLFRNLFRKMLDIHPGEASLHYLYGAYLGAIDSVAAASEQFGYAMDLDPEEEIYARFRVETAIEAGDTMAAIAAGRTAIDRFDNIYYPLVTASLLNLNNEPSSAVELLGLYDINRAENDYQKSLYEETLGDILYGMELKDSAYHAYDRALVYNPDNAGVLNNMAYFITLDNGDLATAERYVKRALLTEPDNPTYIDTYAWVLFKQKDYQGARRQIDKALDQYNRYADTDTINELGAEVLQDEIAEMITGETDSQEIAHETAEITEIAEENDVTTPPSEIYDHAGDIYYMNGEPELALNFWKEALALDPENEKIRKKVTHKAYFFE